MDKTFAEVSGAIPFDWNKALANPPLYGIKEHKTLMKLSRSWVTCACGNQCAIIPRSTDDWMGGPWPIDTDLKQLGVNFNDHIGGGDWASARNTLLAIEKRSAILIREELKKLNQ